MRPGHVQHVESRQNPRLREVARLIGSSRDRRKAQRCVLEGTHLIGVYCDRHGAPETLVVVDEAAGRPDIAALIARVAPSRVLSVSRSMFAEVATMPPEVGALAVVASPHVTAAAPGHFCLLLEDLQDPGNVGTILRSAAAAGVDQVVLSQHCAFAWSPKALRAGQGAHFLTTLIEDADLPAWSRAFRALGGRVVVTVVRDGQSLYAADLAGRVAIAIGNEGSGLSAALLACADLRVTIPMAAGNESLNAAAVAAIVLFESLRQRGLPR
ncbi:MAG: RNA methyltransferase [Betaproteobacteria bacterium]|nr:RNA methyltransferase [Betaproteobacteria bacterium]